MIDHRLISRLHDARKILYVHGMISEQENERAKKRIEKTAARFDQLDALPGEPEGGPDADPEAA